MHQGKLEVIKQEMTRVNINILGISELKWRGMSGFNSDDHYVGDAIQLSHPLSSPFPPALNISQDQGVFKRVSSSHQVAKVLGFQL